MKHALEAATFEFSIEIMGVSKVDRDELAALKRPAMAGASVIENRDVMARLQECIDAVGADEAGSTGYEKFHNQGA